MTNLLLIWLISGLISITIFYYYFKKRPMMSGFLFMIPESYRWVGSFLFVFLVFNLGIIIIPFILIYVIKRNLSLAIDWVIKKIKG